MLLALAGLCLSAGCGNHLLSPPGKQTLFTAKCGDPLAPQSVTRDLVVLGWDGGVSAIHPLHPFPGLDLTAFELVEGGTLADRAWEFKDGVRDAVATILCELPGEVPLVEHDAEVSYAGAANVVLLVQAVAPTGVARVGEAEFDPCNERHDNHAVIFGEQLRRLGGPFTFEQWVTMFANTTAHEIGHMVGLGHISRDERPDPERTLYVELMLEAHTLRELQRAQRVVVEQSACANDSPAMAARSIQPAVVCSCAGHARR